MKADLSATSLLTSAEIFSGKQAVEKNIEAIVQIYNSIKTSYGPLGLDKMCVDASGSVLITNDGATILKNMVIEDPTARLMVNLALSQDEEVGDGTTSVVLLACNLIMKGAQLIREGVHPSLIVSGYRMAFNECIRYIKSSIAKPVSTDLASSDEASTAIINAIINTSISSKIISTESSHFTDIIIKLLKNVSVGTQESPKYNVNKINVLKSIGGSIADSEFFDGFILNCSMASRLMNSNIKNPKILCLGFSLNREKLPLTASIQVTDPDKIEEIRKKEIEMTLNKAWAIIKSGANLVLTTGGIDEAVIKMFIDNGVSAVRRIERADLETLAEAVGTEVKNSIVDIENEYKIENLGSCGVFEIKEINDYELVFLGGCKEPLATVLLRGPNYQVVDEASRALNDAFQVLKRTLESRKIVPGGGAVEVALSFLLEDFAFKTNCKEHIAIHRFADSLLEIPKILASNAALDPSRIVAELINKQHKIYSSECYSVFLGLDVVNGQIQDNLKQGIVEPAIYKLKVLKAATEAAISVLRIHDTIVFPTMK
ncbi:T-complex protein 1 subunit alpha [Enteropsectra breve]|nr:T-complex protein 1 subunit alpha [Enteropsectra breve]